MNKYLRRLLWIGAGLILLGAVLYAWLVLSPVRSVVKEVEETRQALRRDGFKTDLTEFNFSTPAEMQTREAALSAFSPGMRPAAPFEQPDLMVQAGKQSAIVVWKQKSLPAASSQVKWEDLHAMLDGDAGVLDDACGAVLSGPIRFNLDASHGIHMLLRHLPGMKNLAQAFGVRTLLELHDENKDAAWTNLLAATRLITAWEPEPTEVSHLVRFACVIFAYNATWQALQSGGWTDDRLARLQQEWEGVEFFKGLPETAAFQRAGAAAMCRQERNEPAPGPGFPLKMLVTELFRSPGDAWRGLTYYWSHARYRSVGTYEDEKHLLLYYRDRELDLRRAVLAATWSEMRQLPGVTNPVPFTSKYRFSRVQSMLNLRSMSAGFQRLGRSFAGRAAEVETRRRLLITALALERHRGRHGSYPSSLAGLAPEFLKTPPLDFMDGQPLRYQLTGDGRFVLYSTGLDCVDNGGALPQQEGRFGEGEGFYPPPAPALPPGSPPVFAGRLPASSAAYRTRGGPGSAPQSDLVWPSPATDAEVAAWYQEQLAARTASADQQEEMQAAWQWNSAAQRQAEVEKLLDAKPAPARDLVHRGRPLSEVLRNEAASVTNRLTLDEMLTLHQVVTGAEPETVTFEAPIAFDALAGVGKLGLLIDPVQLEDFDAGGEVLSLECNRATNGNCLLVWNTIYEAPGKHALQMSLEVDLESMTLKYPMAPGGNTVSGPLQPFVVSNLCQFSAGSAQFDHEIGATLHCKLPELNGTYRIELKSTNGVLFKTITGSTASGIIKEHWDLTDESGRRLTDEVFDSVFHITLPGSGRSQTLKGP